MTDPALDGPDAEQAIARALRSAFGSYSDEDVDTILAALNEQGVVLCDEHALAELRQRAKAGEAWQAERADWFSAAVAALCPSERERHRYLTDPEFHAEVYRAAQLAVLAMHSLGPRDPR